jgi:hypothetical protein
MSQLFLDTEVRWAVPSVARVAAESGYDDAELERIWKFEVTPEFAGNLWQVAGEWGFFEVDDDRMMARALRVDARPPGRIAEWRYRLAIGGAPMHALFVAVTSLAAILRPLGSEERVARASAWCQASHVYFEERLDDVMLLDSVVGALRALADAGHPVERGIEGALPVFERLLVGGERKTRVRRAANTREVVARALVREGGDPR